MKRKVLWIGNAILIILAVLCGYCIFYLNSQGMYQSTDFYKNKTVLKYFYHYYYNVQNYVNTLYSGCENRNDFLEELDYGRLLPEKSNLRIRFLDGDSRELKTNVQPDEEIHLMIHVPVTVWTETVQEQKEDIYMEMFLAEPFSEIDEFYEFHEKYNFYQKIKIPVIIAEILLIIIILLILKRQISMERSESPGDLAMAFWMMAAIISGMFLYWGYKTNNSVIKIILFQVLALIQYISLIKAAGLAAYQRKKGIFIKNMILSGMNQKVKYILTIACPLTAQCLLSYFWYLDNRRHTWIFVSLQGILLTAELILLLIWIGRNNIRLAAAVEQQMKSERLKTELITNVSHDIKTPVTSIINYVDLIKKEDLKNETVKEYVEVIDRQSLRLKKLVMDVIEASKAVTGNISPVMNPLDIRELLSQAVGEYEERLQKHQLEVVINTENRRRGQDGDIQEEESEAWIVMADGDRLWRVFDNLLSNICKYSAGNTRVYIELQQSEEDFIIIFKNISRDRLNITEEELFERFVRGDAARHTEGSGLGLTIARSLTELMGGKLVIEIEGDMFRAKISFKKI